jgi:hypothetical protein
MNYTDKDNCYYFAHRKLPFKIPIIADIHHYKKDDVIGKYLEEMKISHISSHCVPKIFIVIYDYFDEDIRRVR